uniref:Zodarin 6a n=1 Tax=Zodarion styliferum TaxID=1089303 RepID=A0A8D7ZSZ8_9ARAC|nr:Zodarin 6a precursor [Zodarion styliferum]
MKLYFAVFVVVLSSFCIAETLSNAIDDEGDKELIQLLNEAMKEIHEAIGTENFENSQKKEEFRMDKESIKNLLEKVKLLATTSKECGKQLKDKIKRT